jgi:hypothetical protein
MQRFDPDFRQTPGALKPRRLLFPFLCCYRHNGAEPWQCLQLLQNTSPAASMRNRAALAQFGATLARYKRDYT